ncbi:hypothetical protein K450DRAFT_229217 [Umbelopsis ramanniana AG]|uniref:Uncharacterized protein n=1 Tax=Umbelopsis ramanniana AG TaxID=1314678 RepID=A0AAD5EDZ5_UMBRA|nr:uncharacterized protein K450DRAFT_229217 [Umbelopsis ramanniana AG]KAI8582141.1 hypothetical protein K450DRAFT_229217 [Umbelopsis ramanniana AG]
MEDSGSKSDMLMVKDLPAHATLRWLFLHLTFTAAILVLTVRSILLHPPFRLRRTRTTAKLPLTLLKVSITFKLKEMRVPYVRAETQGRIMLKANIHFF